MRRRVQPPNWGTRCSRAAVAAPPGTRRRGVTANAILMNPSDARARGASEGDLVRVSNESGELEAVVAFDERLMTGTVAMTHGWGNGATPGMRVAHEHPGVNANRLLPTGVGSFEPLSNQAFMTGVPVEIRRA